MDKFWQNYKYVEFLLSLSIQFGCEIPREQIK